jgi:hypothetical protein
MPSNIATYESRIQYLKGISDYHFDPHRDETQPFAIIGWFSHADWKSEVADAIESSQPNTFGDMIDSAKKMGKLRLQFDPSISGDRNYLTGHACFNSVPDSVFKRERFPVLHKMVDWFGLEKESLLARINVQMPGQMFPFHVDGLVETKALDDPKMRKSPAPERLVRVQVMLTDWLWGHAWAIGNHYWKQWRAGEVMHHSWWNIPHGTANFGFSPRVSLQISGVMTETAQTRLEQRNATIDLG